MKLLLLVIAWCGPIHHAQVVPMPPPVVAPAPIRSRVEVAPSATTIEPTTTTTTYPTVLVTDCQATWSEMQTPDKGGDPVEVHGGFEGNCPDVYAVAASHPNAVITQVTNPVGGP